MTDSSIALGGRVTSSRLRPVLVSTVWAIFFVFGLQLAGTGPLISVFAARTGVSIETIGVLFTVQALAGLSAAALVGPAVERFQVRLVLLVGVACVMTGAFGMLVSESFPALLIAGVIGGFGVAFVEASGQLLIMVLYGDKSARPLNSLHFLFSVGAVIGPLIAVQFGVGVFAVGGTILLCLLPLLAWTIPNGIRGGIDGQANVNPNGLYRSPVLWLLALAILLYVGLEIGVGNWTTEYLAGSTEFTRQTAGHIASLYWLSFMISRLVVTTVGNRLTFERQLMFSMGLVILSAAGYILAVGNATAAVIATLALGFSFGPVYPATFAIMTRTFSSAAGRAAGMVGGAVSVGYMLIVPLQGVVLERSGASLMTVYIGILAVAMLVCYFIAIRLARVSAR